MTNLPAGEILRLASDDAAAAAVWAEGIDALAAGLTSATLLLDPAVIVVAGGLSEAGDALLEPLRRELAKRLTWRPGRR